MILEHDNLLISYWTRATCRMDIKRPGSVNSRDPEGLQKKQKKKTKKKTCPGMRSSFSFWPRSTDRLLINMSPGIGYPPGG